jgi:hypothetical protein
LEHVLAREVRRLSVVPSSPLTTEGLGSVAQWGIGGRRVLMDTRGAMEPSSAMAASTMGEAKIMLILTLKTARRFDGGDSLYREYTSCSPQVF